ncbi:MAG: GIY-YIG nuclease family protein, partial [Wolbachia endosymbiont of Pissodes strobi]|nr:GIY-YIG nuclease family protein [Wolbachia endosymbiont of Pissodes strobi]
MLLEHKLKDILIDNGYPLNFLKKLLFNIRINNINNNIHDNINNDISNVCYASFPYIKELTPKIIKIFRNEPVKLALKNVKSIGNLYSKLKDKTIALNYSNLVYSIPCNNCDKKYIGQTSQNLKNRISGHKSDIRLQKNTSALSEHAYITGHIPNFNEIKILHTETNLNKRLFLEMVE